MHFSLPLLMVGAWQQFFLSSKDFIAFFCPKNLLPECCCCCRMSVKISNLLPCLAIISSILSTKLNDTDINSLLLHYGWIYKTNDYGWIYKTNVVHQCDKYMTVLIKDIIVSGLTLISKVIQMLVFLLCIIIRHISR